MTEILNRIVEHLRRLDRGAPDRLQGGLQSEELARWEAELSFAMTGELETLYQWRNGTGEEPGDVFEMRYLFPGFYFVPIEEAAEIYRNQRLDPEWLPGWFPLFANGVGDFYIVPCGREKVAASPVLGWQHGDPDKSAEYDSATSMVQTLEAAFREKAFILDDDGMMDLDQDKYRDIACRFNRTIPKWQR